MSLNTALPFAAATFTLASIASMGLPGFSGFVAELQVLVGAWHAYPALSILTGVGVLIGIAYSLRALLKAFFSDQPASDQTVPNSGLQHLELSPISTPERIGATILVLASLLIGLYPRLLLDLIGPSFGSPLFDGLRKCVGSSWS
jgi:NADH-quinone oxidoreductase subunit M